MIQTASKWYIAQGNIGSGKTHFFKDIIEAAKSNGIPFYGFYQPLLMKEGRRFGYDVVMFANDNQEILPFVRPIDKITPEGMIWTFNQDTIAKTTEFFELCKLQNKPSIVLIDEYGRIESKGKGQWPSVTKLLTRLNQNQIPSNTIISCRKQVRNTLKDSMKSLGYGKEKSTIKLPTNQRKRDKFIKNLIQETLKL